MSYLMSILMGIIQGVAEFLPISSSGHLALFQAFFGMENVEQTHMFFTVLLHFGTLISVCIVYRREILEMILEFCRFVRDIAQGRKEKAPPARRLVLLIVLGTLPLFVMVLVKDLIETLFVSAVPVACMLIVTGCVLYLSDHMARGRKDERTATVADALLVGCAQAVAIIPGLSRSGSTISAGMLRGFDRSFAVRFSFLLSLPAVLGANVLELKDALEVGMDPALLPVYLVGVVTAAVVGYFAIRLVKTLADQGKFGKFAYYCWAVGGVALIAGFILQK